MSRFCQKNEHQIAEDVLILCVQDYATDKFNLSFNVPHELNLIVNFQIRINR